MSNEIIAEVAYGVYNGQMEKEDCPAKDDNTVLGDVSDSAKEIQ